MVGFWSRMCEAASFSACAVRSMALLACYRDVRDLDLCLLQEASFSDTDDICHHSIAEELGLDSAAWPDPLLGADWSGPCPAEFWRSLRLELGRGSFSSSAERTCFWRSHISFTSFSVCSLGKNCIWFLLLCMLKRSLGQRHQVMVKNTPDPQTNTIFVYSKQNCQAEPSLPHSISPQSNLPGQIPWELDIMEPEGFLLPCEFLMHSEHSPLTRICYCRGFYLDECWI